MEHLDSRRVVELLIDVAEGREDHVYEHVKTESVWGFCRYLEGEKPSCIVGHVLMRAGCPIEKLQQMDDADAEISPDIIRVLGHENITFEAVQVLRAAQRLQDRGYTWGEAVQAAQDVYNRHKGVR